MRDPLILVFGITILAAPVLAANLPTPPPGGVARAADGALVMSSQICATLAGPTPGVPSADYHPGVDVNGNAVAPADLPAVPATPTVDNFPIEIDQQLADRFNLPHGGTAKAVIGYVTLRGNQAYFNGQPLNADQSAALAAACRAAGH